MIAQEARALLDKLRCEPRRVFFPFQLPGSNQFEAAQRRTVYVRDNPRSLYELMRKKALDDLVMFAKGFRGKWPPPLGQSLVAINWREPNRHRDPCNISGIARKVVVDALGPGRKGRRGWVGAGLMHCDGWHCVRGFLELVTLADARGAGIEVIIAPVQGELAFPVEPRAAAPLDLRGEAA